MSEHPDTDALEHADFHKYGDDEAVPIACYHRMVAHARDMEASAKSAAKMLGESWENLKESRKLSDDLAETLSDLWHHYSLTGAGYEVVESALAMWRASKSNSSENA